MFVHCTHLFHRSQFTSHSNIAKHPGPWCRGHVRSAASPAYDSFHAKLNHLQISSTILHVSAQKAWKTQSRNARTTCTLLSLFTSYRVISRHSNLIFDADITFTYLYDMHPSGALPSSQKLLSMSSSSVPSFMVAARTAVNASAWGNNSNSDSNNRMGLVTYCIFMCFQ